MNRDFEVYRSPIKDIPLEDLARLEGYLERKAESVQLNRYYRRKKKKNKRKKGR